MPFIKDTIIRLLNDGIPMIEWINKGCFDTTIQGHIDHDVMEKWRKYVKKRWEALMGMLILYSAISSILYNFYDTIMDIYAKILKILSKIPPAYAYIVDLFTHSDRPNRAIILRRKRYFNFNWYYRLPHRKDWRYYYGLHANNISNPSPTFEMYEPKLFKKWETSQFFFRTNNDELLINTICVINDMKYEDYLGYMTSKRHFRPYFNEFIPVKHRIKKKILNHINRWIFWNQDLYYHSNFWFTRYDRYIMDMSADWKKYFKLRQLNLIHAGGRKIRSKKKRKKGKVKRVRYCMDIYLQMRPWKDNRFATNGMFLKNALDRNLINDRVQSIYFRNVSVLSKSFQMADFLVFAVLLVMYLDFTFFDEKFLTFCSNINYNGIDRISTNLMKLAPIFVIFTIIYMLQDIFTVKYYRWRFAKRVSRFQRKTKFWQIWWKETVTQQNNSVLFYKNNYYWNELSTAHMWGHDLFSVHPRGGDFYIDEMTLFNKLYTQKHIELFNVYYKIIYWHIYVERGSKWSKQFPWKKLLPRTFEFWDIPIQYWLFPYQRNRRFDRILPYIRDFEVINPDVEVCKPTIPYPGKSVPSDRIKILGVPYLRLFRNRRYKTKDWWVRWHDDEYYNVRRTYAGEEEQL